jgi:aspartyl/asparaginyl-tRNA synthetase
MASDTVARERAPAVVGRRGDGRRPGLGMGVDRLMIMPTGRTIRDTILFPLVRPTS